MFGWDFEVDAWLRFWRWNLTNICVWTCDMNSTLGSVVPLAMFLNTICWTSLTFYIVLQLQDLTESEKYKGGLCPHFDQCSNSVLAGTRDARGSLFSCPGQLNRWHCQSLSQSDWHLGREEKTKEGGAKFGSPSTWSPHQRKGESAKGRVNGQIFESRWPDGE